MVTNHKELSDDAFLHQLEEGTIDPALFNHEAHIRMAWLYLTRTELEPALASIIKIIRQLDNQYANGKKYHHTITMCFSLIIALQTRQNKFENWQAFIHEHPSLANPKALLAEFYHEATLYSDQAKKRFVPPDKNTAADFLNLVGTVPYLVKYKI